ncbi:hypothetical protein MMC17_006941 [Xylographa soralifera]|nr:hypothetical protein [Xylographa soralifera]
MSTSSSAWIQSGLQDHEHIRPACQVCKRKKIKCDRTFPCRQCKRSSLQCVPSARKTRTTPASKRGRDPELSNRLTKLERFVETLSKEAGLRDGSPGGDLDTEVEPTSVLSSTVSKYIGSPFWSSLTMEVQALRDALEEDQLEDEIEPAQPIASSSGETADLDEYSLIICPPCAVYVMPGALNELTYQMAAALYETFVERVAPVFMVFHLPTLRAFLETDAPYLGLEASATPNKALKATLWFAAVSTMSEIESQIRFGHSRQALLQQYLRYVQVLLVQADLMITTNMATLQALVIYLVSLRMTDMSRRTWTMAGLAVRIARAMGLHHESPGRTPFETEMRRRLWHQICFLDSLAAIDRGTEVMISTGTFDTPLPNNVNDVEFDESSSVIESHVTGLTDMAFALLAYEATNVIQRFNTPEISSSCNTWQQRLDLAHKFGRQVKEKYLRHCDMSIPFHRFISAVGKSMSASMILRAVRPMQPHISSVPPRVDSPYVLQIAVDSLRESERMYEDLEPERWQLLVWVQWHTLAVALAGLCSIRGTELAEIAWVYVDRAYSRNPDRVADTRNGMLWRPIEKLYKKASEFRDGDCRGSHAESQVSADLPSTTLPMGFPPAQYPQMPVEAVPMDPILTYPIDLYVTDEAGGMTPTLQGDMSWLEWERYIDDLSVMKTIHVSNGDT